MAQAVQVPERKPCPLEERHPDIPTDVAGVHGTTAPVREDETLGTGALLVSLELGDQSPGER
jgi:hypothetical protein